MIALKKYLNVKHLSFTLVLLVAMTGTARAADYQSVQQYSMQSMLEYSGKTQFCNLAETVFAVKKQLLSNGKARYVLSADDVAGIGENAASSLRKLSFVIDRKTQNLSAADNDLVLMEKVTNQCAMSLKQVTRGNVGKTWKQSFDLSSIDKSIPGELKFTLTAIQTETQAHGELIAVRALSEPFMIDIAGGSALGRMNCAYVFGPTFEDIFFSASVFSAMTSSNGFPEKLKHTVVSWKVDASGKPARFDELGRNTDFARLISKLGVTRNIRITDAAPLPQWARSEGVRTAQVANLCSSISCEGALNPVATIYLPAASTVGLQSFSESLTLNQIMTAAEGSDKPAAATAKSLKWWPPWANIGWNWPTVAWGAGIGIGAAAIGGGGGGGSSSARSPITP